MKENISADVQADITQLQAELADKNPTLEELTNLALTRAQCRKSMENLSRGHLHPADRTTFGPVTVLDRACIEQPGAVLEFNRALRSIRNKYKN